MATQLEYVRHFKELEVYKRRRELSREVFRLSKGFPVEEKYSLTDQLRRASRSIGAQIAKRLLGLCEEIGRMLGSMIRKAESFSSHEYSLREEPPFYLIKCSLERNSEY